MKCRVCGEVDIPEDEEACDQCLTELEEEAEALEHEIEEYERKRFETWSEYRITELENGSCLVECSTNDNNDDGYPDNEVDMWKMHFKSLEDAIEVTGRSRTGCIGTIVTVWHNGEKI